MNAINIFNLYESLTNEQVTRQTHPFTVGLFIYDIIGATN